MLLNFCIWGLERLFSFSIQHNQPNVIKLPLQLPGQHQMVFEQSDNIAEVVLRENIEKLC